MWLADKYGAYKDYMMGVNLYVLLCANERFMTIDRAAPV